MHWGFTEKLKAFLEVHISSWSQEYSLKNKAFFLTLQKWSTDMWNLLRVSSVFTLKASFFLSKYVHAHIMLKDASERWHSQHWVENVAAPPSALCIHLQSRNVRCYQTLQFSSPDWLNTQTPKLGFVNMIITQNQTIWSFIKRKNEGKSELGSFSQTF